MEDKIVKLVINDDEPEYGKEAALEVFYLKNPDMDKIEKLKILIDNRFDDEDTEFEQFGNVYKYVEENFEQIKPDIVEIEW